MIPAEQKERNFRLSKVIINYFGPLFFKGKKILDLGSGNGELANIFSKLGADLTCVDAREENLKTIQKSFPHLKTLQVNLEEEFPFEEFSFDLILSVDLLCHLKKYEKHIENILLASENIVLETEILDSFDQNLIVPIFESKTEVTLSLLGEGSIVSDKIIQDKISSLNGKFKRIDETKLNFGHFRYDWRLSNQGRRFGNRRLWFIKRDKHLIRSIEAAAELAKVKLEPEYSDRFLKSINKQPLKIGNSLTLSDPKLISDLKSSSEEEIEKAGVKSKNIYIPKSKDKKFVIVIPSYKNEKWCEKNILSALNQNYNDFRIIFTDDCSTDKTFEIVKNAVEKSKNKNKCTLIKNKVRLGALENLYNMIYSCADDEIILTLDGDDWFPNGEVLNKLRNYYNSNDIWMTYGQYKNSNDGAVGVAKQYSDNIIRTNSFRSAPWGASHLRTFYTWLFKMIKKEDLFYQGNFMAMTWDLAIMLPLLEISGTHSKFISDILYVYNLENPLNDHKVDVKLQQKLDRIVRKMPKYKLLKESPISSKPSVGLIVIATGKYDRFTQALISSADKFFLKDGYNITYYIFTDSKKEIKSNRKIITIPIEHRTFPYASMDRFRHFTNNAEILGKEDYLYYCDVDNLFVDSVDGEIIGDLVGVNHCGFYNKKEAPWETNPKSKLYINPSGPKKYKRYYGGGFSGGSSKEYLKLAKWCADIIDEDASNNVIPAVHDESVLNRYFLDNEPTVILSPAYHYPQSGMDRYKKVWKPETFTAKIMLLDKNHKEVRK